MRQEIKPWTRSAVDSVWDLVKSEAKTATLRRVKKNSRTDGGSDVMALCRQCLEGPSERRSRHAELLVPLMWPTDPSRHWIGVYRSLLPTFRLSFSVSGIPTNIMQTILTSARLNKYKCTMDQELTSHALGGLACTRTADMKWRHGRYLEMTSNRKLDSVSRAI